MLGRGGGDNLVRDGRDGVWYWRQKVRSGKGEVNEFDPGCLLKTGCGAWWAFGGRLGQG